MIVRFSGLATPAICYLCGQEKLLLIVSSFCWAEEKLCWGSLDRPSKWPGLSTSCISDPLVQRNDFVTSWARQRGEQLAICQRKTNKLAAFLNWLVDLSISLYQSWSSWWIWSSSLWWWTGLAGWEDIRQFTWEWLRLIRQRRGRGGRHKL